MTSDVSRKPRGCSCRGVKRERDRADGSLPHGGSAFGGASPHLPQPTCACTNMSGRLPSTIWHSRRIWISLDVSMLDCRACGRPATGGVRRGCDHPPRSIQSCSRGSFPRCPRSVTGLRRPCAKPHRAGCRRPSVSPVRRCERALNRCGGCPVVGRRDARSPDGVFERAFVRPQRVALEDARGGSCRSGGRVHVGSERRKRSSPRG